MFFRKRQKIEISYDEVINRLGEIENQLKLLKRIAIDDEYGFNNNLLSTFGGLLITVLHDKSRIENKISTEEKIFLESLNLPMQDYECMKCKVDSLISFLYNSQYQQIEELITKETDLKLKEFLNVIRPLIDTLVADNLMINELQNLENEYNNLIKLKKEYERKNKR